VHAVALGWPVHVLVGDLDSVPAALVEQLAAGGTEVVRHPRAKDHTDLALALALAVEAGASRVTVVGGHGGRLDHLLANVLLLGSDELAAVDVDARMGPSRLTVVRRERELWGVPGEVVSLVALGAGAVGVTTSGLLFGLHDATLAAGTSQGVSNEMTAERATVSVRSGVLAAIQPGERGGLYDPTTGARP
jgi:thiamine pyrophosphokinase